MGIMDRWDDAHGVFVLADFTYDDSEMDSMPEPPPVPSRRPPKVRKGFPETWLWECLESLDNSSGLVHDEGS